MADVGAYTARAVAAFAFGARTPVVDTNVARVLARAIEGHGHAGPRVRAADRAKVESLRAKGTGCRKFGDATKVPIRIRADTIAAALSVGTAEYHDESTRVRQPRWS